MAATRETTNVKKDVFRLLFNTFRGEKATKESAYINTAIEIDEYLDTHNLTEIEEELTRNKTKFDNHGKQNVGGLLSTLLAVKYYQKQCSIADTSEEGRVLQAISTALEGIYDNPLGNYKANMDDLIEKTNEWIDKHALRSTNPELAKHMLRSIFTMCNIVDLMLENADLTMRMMLPISKTRKALKDLMHKLKDLDTQLQLLPISAETVAPTMTVPDDTLPVETTVRPSSVSEYLNMRCLESFADPEGDIVEQIGTASESLVKMSEYLTTLLEERTTYDALAHKLGNARTMLELLNADVTPPPSTLMLIKENEQKYLAFLNDSDADQKKQLTADFNAITPPDISRIGSVMLHVSDYTPTAVSYAASWIAYAFSAILPTNVTERARGVGEEVSAAQRVPILDTAFKEELKRAASERVECLTRELDASTRKIHDVTDQLAPDNKDAQTMITNAPKETLLAVKKTTETTGGILQHCKDLSKEIIADKQMINEINAANKGIRAIVDKPRSFRSMIMMLISKIFKCHYVDQIAEAKKMSDTLETIKQECTDKLNHAVAEINHAVSEINEEKSQEAVNTTLKRQLNKEIPATYETLRAPQGSLTIFESVSVQVEKIVEKHRKMKDEDNPRPSIPPK